MVAGVRRIMWTMYLYLGANLVWGGAMLVGVVPRGVVNERVGGAGWVAVLR